MGREIVFVVGARPNFMKCAPVYRALGDNAPDLRPILLHTGQHYDAAMSQVFLTELRLPEPDIYLGIGSGTHGQQTARALEGVEAALLERSPSLVVVAGDVNSTLAAALAAVKLGIPVAHIEAGLRSGDRSMPEEHNRRLTDHLSDVLLTHSEEADANLRSEGIPGERIHLVGNTMIDSVLEHRDVARSSRPWAALGLEEAEYGLVTLHRPALVDDSEALRRTVLALRRLADFAPLVFPVHPRTRVELTSLGLLTPLCDQRVVVTEPLGYLQFLGLQDGARFVVTDSGGIQEETSALGVPCFTYRDTTERPVTVTAGTNRLIGTDPERLLEIPALLDHAPASRAGAIPLWDGSAGRRAAAVLAGFVRDAMVR